MLADPLWRGITITENKVFKAFVSESFWIQIVAVFEDYQSAVSQDLNCYWGKEEYVEIFVEGILPSVTAAILVD